MFYSQFGQDKYFDSLFPQNYKGKCVEIGAYDGRTDSNTLYFENKGWDCLCIEANCEMFNKCQKIRKNSVNYCVSNENNDDSIFNIFKLGHNNQSAISSHKPDQRLIDSHKELIIDSFQQKVKTRTLTTILNENNFYKDIDLVTIDTENTEIDVLHGIDFDMYNIKYLLIENNYSEDKCETYLKNKGFDKIYRIGKDDVYIKKELQYNSDKINRYFKILSAYYHEYNKCDKFNSNITEIVLSHFKEYLLDNSKNILKINNDNFKDTYLGHKKNLYLNFQTIIGERCLIIEENGILDWIKFTEELETEYHYYMRPNNLLKNITIGETINSYLFNLLKYNEDYIMDIDNIHISFKNLYISYEYFFDILLYFNKIYLLNKNKLSLINLNNNSLNNLNDIKYLVTTINKYEKNINRIIKYFNYFIGINNICNTNNNNEIYIHIENDIQILNKIPELNMLFIEYDKVYIHNKYEKIIGSIFKNTNIIFEDNLKLYNLDMTILNEYSINSELKPIYEFKPIKYISSGKLGDFLNSLSVINENFYSTGKKGILYISDQHKGDNFKLGLEKTYDELYNLIINQNYIHEFKIYKDEEYDLNLNIWREFIKTPTNDYTKFYNWKNIFKYTFKVDWCEHKWLNNIYYDELWSNKIIINITTYRAPSNHNCIKNIVSENKNNLYFVTFDENEYNYFIEKYELNKNDVHLYTLKNIDELCVIINSCKYPYFGISSFAVIANSLHKNHSLFSCDENFGNFTNNMVNVLPHVLEFI